MTRILRNDDLRHQNFEINIAWLNPQVHEIFANTIVFNPVLINDRQYIYKSDVERDEFDKYWNQPAPKASVGRPGEGDGNGCRGVLHGFIGLLIIFFVLIIMAFLISGCSHKTQVRRDKKGEHRPRYNHWAKPYEMYAPVKQHNPSRQ